VKRLIIFFLVVSQAACSNRSSIPKGIIPLDTMQKVMKEMILAGEYSVQYISKDTLKQDKVKANQDLMETIFSVHHISATDFKNSLSFYESRPDLNKIIFDSIAADANRHKTEFYTNPKPPLIRPPLLPAKGAIKPPRIPAKRAL
jgi:Domain of unknown function (DUF4296)